MVKTVKTKAIKPAEPKDEIPDYKIIRGLEKSKLPVVARRLRDIDDEISALKETKKQLSDQGVTILLKAGVKSVMVGDLRVTRADGMSAQISKTRLMELGVEIGLIEKATSRTPYTYLKVTPPKVESD